MKGKKLGIEELEKKLEQCKITRRQIFKDLLAHVRKGRSLDCFGALSDNSIKEYLKAYPEEFVRKELDQAIRDAKDMWEEIGHQQSTGKCLGNSRSWYYNMSNRYGWRDKIDIEAEHKGQVSVNIVSYASSKPSSDSVSKDKA